MHLSNDDKISFMEREETMNLSEILPEPHSDWELHTDGGYYKIIENTKFCRYIAPCKENTANDDFYTEIGLYSKIPFTNPESLKRKFSWIMAEFLLHPPVSYEKRTDGWFMFVTDRANFNHYLEFVRQAVEDE